MRSWDRPLLACVLLSGALGTIHSFSLFIEPFEADLGAGRGGVASVYSVALVTLTVVVLVGHPLFRRVPGPMVALLATGGAAVGLLLAASASSLVGLLIGYGIVFGGCNGLGYAFSLQRAAEELDRTLSSLPSGKEKAAVGKHTGKVAGFEKLQGLLSMPVKGKIVSFFGPYRDTRLNVVNFQNGIDVEADRGEPVRAVASGYTMFASWVQGYGNLIIIDHGQHYYTVYAHLEEMFKVKGEAVDKDEVIATVGDSGSLAGPGLHFEIRHGGKPLDPMDWFKHN